VIEAEAGPGTEEHREDGDGIGSDAEPSKEPDEVKAEGTYEMEVQPIVGL
jgi:hypothetical protein